MLRKLLVTGSTRIEEIHYDTDTLVMTIKFKSGQTYEYQKVPAKEFDAFKKAESVGIQFNDFSKKGYEYAKIDG